jgi:hypothetical protein
LIDAPGALETLIARARELGYTPHAVLVLRAQPDYLESLYGEIAGHFAACESFEAVLETALERSVFALRGYTRAFPLRYGALIESLEAVFGPGRVVARAYRTDRGSAYGRQDFLGVVSRFHGAFAIADPYDPTPRVNERLTLLALLERIVCARGRQLATRDVVTVLPGFDPTELARPFSFLTRRDRARFLQRLAADNVAVNERFAIDIPFVAERDIAMSDADEGRAQAHRALLAAVLERLD